MFSICGTHSNQRQIEGEELRVLSYLLSSDSKRENCFHVYICNKSISSKRYFSYLVFQVNSGNFVVNTNTHRKRDIDTP